MNPEETTKDTEEVRKLKLQVTQLKNIIKKLTGQEQDDPNQSGYEGKKKKSDRKFDFNLYKKRHVVFRIAYFGWDYHGFAVQETSGKTIESELFSALLRTRLIESRETSNYHRCGRTDKGVSAFHQVISIDVRSNLMDGIGVFEQEGCRAQDRIKNPNEPLNEIQYCKILNSNLPNHIQVIAWAPCTSLDFSARFDCISRTYKYFFPKANLNLELMNQAGQRLLGEHDFRNFCKMDVNNGVTNYVRNIELVKAEEFSQDLDSPGYSVCVVTVKGRAFLWHQIRCIVSVLIRIAQGNESQDVIDELLDVKKNPCRPQYSMAWEVPLNLYNCDFSTDLDWQYEEEAVQFVMKQFQALWCEHQVKGGMLRSALKDLEAHPVMSQFMEDWQSDPILPKGRTKTYVPLLQLKKCPSLEEKMSVCDAKRRKCE